MIDQTESIYHRLSSKYLNQTVRDVCLKSFWCPFPASRFVNNTCYVPNLKRIGPNLANYSLVSTLLLILPALSLFPSVSSFFFSIILNHARCYLPVVLSITGFRQAKIYKTNSWILKKGFKIQNLRNK